MPERNPPMSPEVAAALRAYEIEMLDGTERSQRKAMEKLRAAQRQVGAAAIIAANSEAIAEDRTEQTEPKRAAS